MKSPVGLQDQRHTVLQENMNIVNISYRKQKLEDDDSGVIINGSQLAMLTGKLDFCNTRSCMNLSPQVSRKLQRD